MNPKANDKSLSIEERNKYRSPSRRLVPKGEQKKRGPKSGPRRCACTKIAGEHRMGPAPVCDSCYEIDRRRTAKELERESRQRASSALDEFYWCPPPGIILGF